MVDKFCPIARVPVYVLQTFSTLREYFFPSLTDERQCKLTTSPEIHGQKTTAII